jgi:hypothetical protein
LALNADGVEVDVVAVRTAGVPRTVPARSRAVELYRGDLLLGFNVNEPLFEEWLVTERERLREMAMEALAKLLAHQTRAGATERAIQTAVRLLGLDPLQEAVHRTLMRLYSRQGRRGAALKQYQTCVGVLQRELGTAPESETKQLYRSRAPSGGAPQAPGVHADRPQPAPGGSAPSPRRRDAPSRTAVEMERLRQLLDEAIRGQGHSGIVVGEAGIGKTRLVSTLAADALAQGCRVLIGHCHESDSILPFGPWVEACRTGGVSTDEEILNALHPRWRTELTRLLPEAGQAGSVVTSDSALPLFEGGLAHGARSPLGSLWSWYWRPALGGRDESALLRRGQHPGGGRPDRHAREEELTDASTPGGRWRAGPGAADHGGRARPVPRRRRCQRAPLASGHAAAIAKVEGRIWAMSGGNPFVALEGCALDQDSLSAEVGPDGPPAADPSPAGWTASARTQQVAAAAVSRQ